MPATKDRLKIDQLRNLSESPARQLELALEYIRRDRSFEVVMSAIKVASDFDIAGIRPTLIDRYQRCQTGKGRTDPGGLIRIAIINALKRNLIVDDIDLLASATLTYEYRPAESAGQLRATGLVALHAIDPELAGYHAARLLVDPATAPMSGEPALTAVRVLAAGGNELPLYAYVFAGAGTLPEVTAECLRNLVTLPASLLSPIIDSYIGSKDQIVLLGLFDLLLNNPAAGEYSEVIFNFLNETRLLEIFHFVVSELVAHGNEQNLERLETMANFETNRDKEEILRQALEFR